MSYLAAVLARSPIAYWRLGETSGTTAVDRSGNGQDGTYTGGPTLNQTGLLTGDSNPAIDLDGVNDHVALPSAVYFNGDFTITAWVKPDAFGSWSRIVDLGQGQGDDNVIFAFGNGANGVLAFQVYVGGTAGNLLVGNSALSTGVVAFVAARLSGTTGTIWKNGASVASGSCSVPADVTRNLSYIGRSNWASDAYADGIVDEVAFFARALSDAELLALYQAGAPYPAAVLDRSPLAYWRLGEASGTTAVDTSGNSRTGTYSGGFTLGQSGALTGDPDSAVALDGSSGYVQAADADAFDFPGNAAFTLAAWIKPDVIDTTYRRIVDKESATGGRNGWAFGLHSTDGLFVARLLNGTEQSAFAPSSHLSTGAWNHVVATYDGATLTLYANGVARGTAASAQSISATTQVVAIGRSTVFGAYFDGTIDEVAVFSSALTAADIRTLYDAGIHALNFSAYLLPAAAPESYVAELQATRVFLNGIDRTAAIKLESLRIREQRRARGATCEFVYQTVDGSPARPQGGNQVNVLNGATTEFAGHLLVPSFDLWRNELGQVCIDYHCQCGDFTWELDKFMVYDRDSGSSKVYPSQAAGTIATSLVNTYSDGRFVTTSIETGLTVQDQEFDAQPLSDCLERLATESGYLWRVTFERDIEFTALASTVAPIAALDLDTDPRLYEISGDDGDVSQIKNPILLKDVQLREETKINEYFTGNGVSRFFPLAYNPSPRTADMTISAAGGVWQVALDDQSGRTPVDATTASGTAYLCVFNRGLRLGSALPAGSVFTASYNRMTPRLAWYSDAGAIADMAVRESALRGEHEYAYSLPAVAATDSGQIEARAQLVLLQYARPQTNVVFKTRVTGWRSGQYTQVSSAGLDLNRRMYVDSVDKTFLNESEVEYVVRLTDRIHREG